MLLLSLLEREPLPLSGLDEVRGDVDVVVKSSDSSPIGELELGEVAGDLLLNLGWKKTYFWSIENSYKYN